MTKNFNFNLWILLLVLVIFFSSSSIAYASEASSSESNYTEADLELINYIKHLQAYKNINTQANNYLVFHYRGLYYIHISEKNFELGTFTHELVQRTGIKTSGWWLYNTHLSLDQSDYDEWQFIPWSNKNYDMNYYDENYITYQGEVVVNFALDEEPVMHIIFCSEDLDGFYSGSVEDEEDTETDITTPDYTEQHNTIIDHLIELPTTIKNGIVNGIKELFIPSADYLEIKKSQLEASFTDLMGFDVNEVQKMFEADDTAEVIISGENSTIHINGIGNIQFKTFDNKFLLDGLNRFRPIIRGFTVLMLAFFNLNQLLNIIGQSSLTGLTNYKGGKKE